MDVYCPRLIIFCFHYFIWTMLPIFPKPFLCQTSNFGVNGLCLKPVQHSIGISQAVLQHSWKLWMHGQLDSSHLTMLSISISLSFSTSPCFYVSPFIPCNLAKSQARNWRGHAPVPLFLLISCTRLLLRRSAGFWSIHGRHVCRSVDKNLLTGAFFISL
jgi:hypothetical protein